LIANREEHRRQHSISRSAWLAAGQAGLLGVALPEELGGAGGDFRFNAVMAEELARAGLAYASSFGIHTDVVAPYLLELTDAGQRERWLPRFATGELITAIGMTEPEAGSDLAALRTTAKADGDGWVLNGGKTFITNGAGADLVIVAARTGEGRTAISLFAVEKGSPGFVQGAPLDKVGQPEADTAELFFEDVRLPAEALLGEVGKGFAYMMERLPQERLSAAFANLGHAAASLADTLVYVQERRAFGRPVGTFQNSRFVLAEASTAVDVAFAFADRCLAEHVAGRLDPIDAAKAKWWSAEVQNQVIDACVQLHGGYDYMDEYGVARAWADARVTKIWAGSNEIMKEVIGRSLGLGEPRQR
ncbi:MAG: acyl-CoA dehydrogenase family protein, partial [Actinobacteria bacterium]|nr:acyl-CoA dehydrogenase family protein [Actinomycetota bacterium]